MHIIYTLCLSLCFAIPLMAQTTPDYPFEVKVTGSGPQAMVLIPGFACSGEVWAETISVFDKGFTCHTLTMAGFAGVPPKPNPSFENWKAAIANYIENMALAKPILVGHSMGGGLAMAIAADSPQRVGKIIVVDALPCLAALANPSFAPQANVDCTPMVKRLAAMPEGQFYQMQKISMVQLLQNQDQLATVLQWTVASDRHTFAQMYCDFANTDLRNKIQHIQCPALVLLEANFKHFRQAIGHQYKNLGGADLQYANKGLHFIMYDDQAWYIEQLTRFVAHD